MPVAIGTSQVKIRNIEKIDIFGQYIADNEPISNTMFGEFIEQGVTFSITQGTSTSVANGAKVGTSEKVLCSWTLLGDTLEQMDSAMSFTGSYPSQFGIRVNSVKITLIGGKTITILKPVISCQRAVKVGDLFRYNFSIEKNDDNADTIVVFA